MPPSRAQGAAAGARLGTTCVQSFCRTHRLPAPRPRQRHEAQHPRQAGTTPTRAGRRPPSPGASTRRAREPRRPPPRPALRPPGIRPNLTRPTTPGKKPWKQPTSASRSQTVGSRDAEHTQPGALQSHGGGGAPRNVHALAGFDTGPARPPDLAPLWGASVQQRGRSHGPRQKPRKVCGAPT